MEALKKHTKYYAIIISTVMLTASGCASKEPAAPAQQEASVTEVSVEEKEEEIKPEIKQETEPEQPAEEIKEEQKEELPGALDITNYNQIWKFLAGDWRVCDPADGTEYATLTFKADHSCSYRRDTDDLSFEGTFDISRHYTYDEAHDRTERDDQYTSFTLDVPRMPDLPDLPQAYTEHVDSCSSMGNFYLSRDNSYDYLYLMYYGNDISFIFENLFQNYDRLRQEYDKTGSVQAQKRWVFRRENGGDDTYKPELVTDSTFNGFVWNRDQDNGLWIQQMDTFMYQSREDYTNRCYFAGYLSEKQDINLARYELSPETDTRGVFKESCLNSSCPLLMCSISTDREGRIRQIKELDMSYYGIYDLGKDAQEYSYDGLTFTVNGTTIELGKDVDTSVNAITDMYQVGDDWIVVEGHVNPHMNAYYLYNIYQTWIVKTLWGGNLTWVGDDITTAVYSQNESVYDFKDNLIGMTDGTEVMDISYDSTGTTLTVTDFNGSTYIMEPGAKDTAMYRYADFKRTYDPSDWKKFMDEAPDDAIAFVMGNPPYDIQNLLLRVNLTDGGSDYLYIVALKDNTEIRFNYGDFDIPSLKLVSKKNIHSTKINKGESVGYQAVLTEGVPSYGVYVITDDAGGVFNVTQISGKDDSCGVFITGSMTRKEALEESETPEGSSGDIYELYSSVLGKYKGVQEGTYDLDRMMKEGLTTELGLYAWPDGAANDKVRYLLYDVNSDGKDELIITYYGSIVDIYGTGENGLRKAFGSVPRGEAILYNNGMLGESYSIAADTARYTWYRYDAELGEFYPSVGYLWESDENGKETSSYFLFSYETRRDEIAKTCRDTGKDPAWIWDRAAEITEAEYTKRTADYINVTLPEGTRISDFTGF